MFLNHDRNEVFGFILLAAVKCSECYSSPWSDKNDCRLLLWTGERQRERERERRCVEREKERLKGVEKENERERERK